mmetsp:Transcript_88891/g.252022  ORF Transcript_88891/g.252022 Transcript_88891/m.252022 type:complete len:226 (-) Transcript_88891:281-958(-)
MVVSPFGSVPRRWTHCQHLVDQILGILGDMSPILRVIGISAALHLLQNLLVRIRVVEWRVPAEQHVHDHPAAPGVAQLVVPPLQHLGGDVVGRARPCGKLCTTWCEFSRQAEVNELQSIALDRGLGGEKEVFRLQIAMADPVFVHVVDGTYHLLHHDRSVGLFEMTLCNDAVEKFAAVAKLHDQIEVLGIFKRLMELDYAWVVQALHYLDLSLELLQRLGVHASP